MAKYFLVMFKDESMPAGAVIADQDWAKDNICTHAQSITVEEVVEVLPESLTVEHVNKSRKRPQVYVTGKNFGTWLDKENMIAKWKVSK